MVVFCTQTLHSSLPSFLPLLTLVSLLFYFSYLLTALSYLDYPSFIFTLLPFLLISYSFHLPWQCFLIFRQIGNLWLQLAVGRVGTLPFASPGQQPTSMMFHDDTPLLPPSSSALLFHPWISFFCTASFSPCLFGPPLGWLLLAAPVPPTLSLDILFIGPQRGWLSVQGVCCLKQCSLNKRGRSSLWFMCSLSVSVNRHQCTITDIHPPTTLSIITQNLKCISNSTDKAGGGYVIPV